jgi:alpha-L-fucosidase
MTNQAVPVPRWATFALTLVSLLLAAGAAAPTGSPAAGDRETDPLVLRKLDWFQDQKLGLLLHWGPYSQWGVVESWSICPEDEDWCRRRGPHAGSYDEYRRAYESLKGTFNPVRFDPDAWAAAAQDAGMRYVVFTTKHHDGFCMFETRETDYKVTDRGCPFSANPRHDIAREIFDAFRRRGLGIGAYFSKADWHSPDYWWPYFPPLDRNVNYDPRKYAERWTAFKTFTFNQIRELMRGYGSVDILWLDGGWVRPAASGVPGTGRNRADQDIDMPKIAAMARSLQPGLIIVDRDVGGRYENYRTPEQQVPETAPGYRWETCMTMGTSWSYVPADTYKPARELVHTLVNIVAKGGNLLLNIGPGPDGELPPVSLQRLKELGAWMTVNGSAIYATRSVPPYTEGRLRFTRMRDGAINAIYLAGKNETLPPESVRIESFAPAPGSTVSMLGAQAPLTWEKSGRGFVLHVDKATRAHPPCAHAWAFRFTPETTGR